MVTQNYRTVTVIEATAILISTIIGVGVLALSRLAAEADNSRIVRKQGPPEFNIERSAAFRGSFNPQNALCGCERNAASISLGNWLFKMVW